MYIIPFEQLDDTDLIVDSIYEGDSSHLKGEPLTNLLSVQNMGGFRYSGTGLNKNFVVLFSSGENEDWPDSLDIANGLFTYYGDNRTQGDLHDTTRKGNLILRECFDATASESRSQVPPFFIFQKFPTPKSPRSVKFRGLAVPGSSTHSIQDDLVAIWRSSGGNRFQNYIATFTILDENIIKREWIEDLLKGIRYTDNAPKKWEAWVETGSYNPLLSQPTTLIRTKEDQTPNDPHRKAILQTLFNHFKGNPSAFEPFAAEIYRLLQSDRITIDTITRPTADGGRDAVGRYQIGMPTDPVFVNFALEAKCYDPGLYGSKANSCGVREISRLTSRLRYREFGVIVTTSYFARQAYEEIRNDGNPVVLISGRDITDILISRDINTTDKLSRKLQLEFPVG